jgi:uncharacterized OB-fold protein
MAVDTKARTAKPEPASSIAPVGAAEPRKEKSPTERAPAVPFLIDSYPLQDELSMQLSGFYDALKSGRLTTTRCAKDGLLWPPRVVCPHCHASELEWVDLPRRGRLYAFSAVLAGAPMGMESEVPYVVGLVDIDGTNLRLFGRVAGSPWTECRIGQTVEAETFSIPDGRWFYRFRTASP